jgi:hypothetical protein
MSGRQLSAAVGVAVCLIIGGVFLYTYESDKTAWDEVQSKLIRLDSGLEYESIIQLRSKLADADAASKEYTVHKHIFPTHGSQRIADSEQAISYLDVALTLHSSSESSVPNEMMAALEEHAAVTTLIPRVCTNGYLRIDRSTAESAFFSEGLAYLRRAQSNEWKPIPALGPYPRLEFVNEQEQCQQKDQKARLQIEDEREAAIRKRWSAWRYHIQIKASESCTFRIASDGADGGFSIVHEGADKEFGVNTSLTLSRFICAGSTAPKVAIQVYVNEKPVKLDWQFDAINVITSAN